MRLKDVPQIIEEGQNYENVSIKRLIPYLEELKESYGLDCNPDFQRSADQWTEEQQTLYVEFILRGGRTASTFYFNCPFYSNMGTLKDYENGKYDHPMVLVDGLQRITAIKKFFDNDLKVFGHYLDEFEDKKEFFTGMRHLVTININVLPTKKDVLTWYIQMNKGLTAHSNEEILRVEKMLEDIENKEVDDSNKDNLNYLNSKLIKPIKENDVICIEENCDGFNNEKELYEVLLKIDDKFYFVASDSKGNPLCYKEDVKEDIKSKDILSLGEWSKEEIDTYLYNSVTETIESRKLADLETISETGNIEANAQYIKELEKEMN